MDDLISRQDARRIIEDINTFVSGWWYSALEQIDELPTAEKRGKWIEHNPHKWGLGIVFECSECGEEVNCEACNYCPNCGSRNTEESDEADKREE